MSKKIAMVLGIRPDIIRASLFIKLMRETLGKNFILIWSGQHYSVNLKDVFFQELSVEAPDVELAIHGSTDAQLVADLLPKLSDVLEAIDPDAVIFLGDTNTVIGSIAAAQLNIPIIHIEGCMRSYDWRMPEEKYRKITDHLSDLIFSYLPEYKELGIAEGIPNENIEVCGNPIVDVLQEFFLSGKLRLRKAEFETLLLDKYFLNPQIPFALMTCHRRENVENFEDLSRILELASRAEMPVIFPAGYRTQTELKRFNLKLSPNIKLIDPIGYLEILELLNASEFVLSDSGTLIEEAAIIGTPSIQMRRSTERPQVYEWGASIKFDPSCDQEPESIIRKVSSLKEARWEHKFGNGDSSQFIFDSIIEKLESGEFSRHEPDLYLPWSRASYSSESD
jgi:UDP-N-acetylglucosamine 2-epimerase (non-hydrolysing)